MITNDTSGTEGGQAAAKVCNLLHLFLQDVSFEAPNVPGILFGHDQPAFEYEISNAYSLSAEASKNLAQVFAVKVRVTVKAVAGDKTLFLIEVQQGGLFEVSGYGAEEQDFILRTKAPEALFPFSRELINSLITRAGFPSVQLRPINFESRYALAMQEHSDSLKEPAPGLA